jgi:hypothetical protein
MGWKDDWRYMWKYDGPVIVNNKIIIMKWREDVDSASSEEEAKKVLAIKFKNKFDNIDDGARIVFVDKCLNKLCRTF